MGQLEGGLDVVKSITSLFWQEHVFDAKMPDETSGRGKMGKGSGPDKSRSNCTIAHRSSSDF